MLKIYASGIQDLTVARYFAAMNVDLAGFGVSPDNLPVISSIKEWIQGPHTVAEPLHFEGAESWLQLFTASDMDYMLLPLGINAEENIPAILSLPYGQPPEKNKIFVIEVPDDLKPAAFNKSIYENANAKGLYFDLPLFTDEWLDLITQIPDSGLVIKAGLEERPGIKSFETIDKLFEKMDR